MEHARRAVRALVTVALCAAVVALGTAVGAELIGYRLMVVRSGSMRPAIMVGDIVVSEAARASSVRPGEIVTFRDPALGGVTVTHRVMSVRADGDTYRFVTKGDANTGTERWSIARNGTLGRKVLTIPAVGKLIFFLRSRFALLAALLVGAAWMMAIGLRRIWSLSAGRQPGNGRAQQATRLVGAVLVATGAFSVARSSTAAAWAVTNQNDANAFATAASFPSITSVVLANTSGGTAGRMQKGDMITVTFSETMQVSSFCSTWSGNGSNQTLSTNNDVTVRVQDGTGATNDVVTVTSATCSFNFGSIDLGSNNYVSGGNGTFSGAGGNKSTIAWTAATHVLTITLGAATGTFNPVASSTPTYTASGSITNPAGTPVYNSPYSLANGQQF
jgi:signal peptidase I